ncbi:TonB-dependent receptor domain-containing protein [Asticcacaulis tiandongensis]|uniref:TonB-dependent receptor domain-containing protein n=1 Tax=Asticcacaulis tiandongensis TaxID=2565365 RepID=UPI0015E855AD|nr:TonB-dependent receptor [Asticcacaulis tiandongensis]
MGSGKNSVRLRGVLASCLLATTALSGFVAFPALAQAQAGHSYDIPAGGLTQALNRFSEQAGIELFYSAELTRGVSSKGLKGSYGVSDGLSRLLADTGLTYRQTGATAFTLEKAPASAGALQLGAIRVEGTVNTAGGMVSGSRGISDEGFDADSPFATAGSVSHITREQIERIPPTSTGDMFLNTLGVISAGNRNGQSLDLNIRGLQGMNRVATLIDGAAQTTSTYRGYGGASSRTFVDPDLIGGIDVSKGPSDSAYGAGAMGGVVNMRTLIAHDLVGEGNRFGFRIRAGVHDNTVDPSPISNGNQIQQFGRDRGLSTDARNLSVTGAYKADRFEFVAGFVERVNGNYYGGKNGNSTIELIAPRTGVVTEHPMTRYQRGGEIFNTSQETQSVLLKGTVRYGDGHAIELGYIRYDSQYGEEYPDANNPFSQWAWIAQEPISEVLSNVYTAKYRWKPADSRLIDLHAELWVSDIEDYWATMDSQVSSVTSGTDIWNRAFLNTGFGELSLKYGAQYSFEESRNRVRNPRPWGDNTAFDGKRHVSRAYINADLDVNEWVRLSGGLSQEAFRTRGANWRNQAPLSLRDSRLNPRVGVTVSPADGLQLFASYAEGWRPATLRETLLDMDDLIRPNPLLRPEVSKNVEFGFNILRDGLFSDTDRLKLKLAYFDNSYEDFIMREYGTAFGLPTNYRTYTNVPEVHFRGVEVAFDYGFRNLFIEGNINRYTDVQFCNATGENSYEPCGDYTSGNDYMSQAVPPEYAGSVTFGGHFLSDKLTLGLRTVFAGERAVGRKAISTGSSNPSDWVSYAVYDLFGSYEVNDHLTINGSVENVGNRFYMDALTRARTPSPGRTVRLSLTSQYGGPKSASKRHQALGYDSRLAAFDGDWSGFYIGGLTGAVNYESDAKVTLGDGSSSDESGLFKGDGVTGGFVAGYNRQLQNRWVMGVEAEVSSGTAEGSYSIKTGESANLIRNQSAEAAYRSEARLYANLRGRVGYAFDRTLVYGTAGLAALQTEETREQFRGMTAGVNPNNTQRYFSESDKVTRTGWVAGFGAEFALSDNWSLKGEYLNSDFGKKSHNFDDARTGVIQNYVTRVAQRDPLTNDYVRDPDTNAIIYDETNHTGSAEVVNGRKVRSDVRSQTLRVGLNYRF